MVFIYSIFFNLNVLGYLKIIFLDALKKTFIVFADFTEKHHCRHKEISKAFTVHINRESRGHLLKRNL
jgi:hypothetical protein